MQNPPKASTPDELVELYSPAGQAALKKRTVQQFQDATSSDALAAEEAAAAAVADVAGASSPFLQLPIGWDSVMAKTGGMYYWHVADPKGTKTWKMPLGTKVWGQSPPKIMIFVKPMPMGKRIPLVVTASDTIADVKNQICAIEGVGPSHQRLSLKPQGTRKMLRRGRTLSHLNIKHLDCIYAHWSTSIEERRQWRKQRRLSVRGEKEKEKVRKMERDIVGSPSASSPSSSNPKRKRV